MDRPNTALQAASTPAEFSHPGRCQRQLTPDLVFCFSRWQSEGVNYIGRASIVIFVIFEYLLLDPSMPQAISALSARGGMRQPLLL